MKGSGFRVSDFGFRASGLGFRVLGKLVGPLCYQEEQRFGPGCSRHSSDVRLTRTTSVTAVVQVVIEVRRRSASMLL